MHKQAVRLEVLPGVSKEVRGRDRRPSGGSVLESFRETREGVRAEERRFQVRLVASDGKTQRVEVTAHTTGGATEAALMRCSLARARIVLIREV